MDNQNVSLRGVLLLDKLQDDRTTQFQNFLEIVITTLTDLEVKLIFPFWYISK